MFSSCIGTRVKGDYVEVVLGKNDFRSRSCQERLLKSFLPRTTLEVRTSQEQRASQEPFSDELHHTHTILLPPDLNI